MNKKINIMFILTAIAIVSIGVVYTQNYDAKTELSQQDSGSLVPPGDKIKQKIHTKEIANLSEIKNLKGYDISIGKNLPKGYKVQYVAGSIPPDNYVNIYVGKEPITDETTDMGFVYGGGDSGSPIFAITSGDNVSLYGMAYRANTDSTTMAYVKYHPWEQIQNQIGATPP